MVQILRLFNTDAYYFPMLDLRRTREVIETRQTAGLHTGAQLYISRDGRAVADLAFGEARPGVPMRSDTIMLWLSSGKPLTAVALAKLWEAGRLDLDDPVAKFIPEFAAAGKEAITIRHLLTHTAGIRWADFSNSDDWDQIIAKICAARPEPRWIFGRTAGYHPLTSWYILAEIIHRLDPKQRRFEQFGTDEILSPLQMRDCSWNLSPEQYAALRDRIGIIIPTGPPDLRLIRFDSPGFSRLVVPGASARGPIRELGKFYEMLLDRGRLPDGSSLLTPQTVEALTARHRAGIVDLTFKRIIDWGLGFIINSSQYGDPNLPYGYGPHASPRAFGHGGSQSSAGMADPEYGLAVAVVFNGMPGETAHQERISALFKAIYEDLNLAP
ncbi:MAG: serine hydrolase domain-containing protein [Tepidisphaeraceae bacterium]